MNIMSTVDNKKPCTALFIDLSKASDTVDHTLLLKKLYNIGSDEVAYNWFQSYLMDRQQCESMGSVKSEFVQIAKGVPQGSVHGPVLFTLHINDIVSAVTGCNIHLNADDSILYCTADTVQSAVVSLQHCFADLEVALKIPKLTQTKPNLCFSLEPKILIWITSSSQLKVAPILKESWYTNTLAFGLM